MAYRKWFYQIKEEPCKVWKIHKRCLKKQLDIHDIELISNSNPKHKPNVKDSFFNLQRSEIYFFLKNGIHNIEDFNTIKKKLLLFTIT